MSILKASEYLKGLKYNLMAKNNYDTLSGKVMINRDSSDTLISTDTITITPSWDSDFTRQAYQKNYSMGNRNNWYDLAHSNVAVRMATQTIQFHNLTTPIVANPYVKLTFAGTTYKIDRGNNFTLEDIHPIYKDAAQVSNFIRTHADVETDTWTGNSDSVDYDSNKLNMFAWVKRAVLSNARDMTTLALDGTDEYENNKPAVADILTTWAGGVNGMEGCRCCQNCPSNESPFSSLRMGGSWYYNDVEIRFPNTYPNPIKDMDTNAPLTTPYRNALYQSVAYQEIYEYITINIIKYDEYNFDVQITYPEKYQYVAASRYVKLGIFSVISEVGQLESYAFTDFIESIQVDLYGTTYDENTEDFSNSLQDDSIIDGKNGNILKLDNNELITKDATWSGTNWKTKATQEILSRYEKGLTTIELTVPASYAIENNIKINSPFYIKTTDNELIERGYRVAAYDVKNITKTYNDEQFTWTLKLLENKDESQVIIDGAELLRVTNYITSEVNLDYEGVFHDVSNGYDIIPLGEELSSATLDTVKSHGLNIRLPQLTGDDIKADKGSVILEGYNDINPKEKTLAIVIKMPIWATFSWAIPEWPSSSTFYPTTFTSKIGYYIKDDNNEGLLNAKWFECNRYLVAQETGGTLNPDCMYAIATFKVTAQELSQGIIPLFAGGGIAPLSFLMGCGAQIQYFLIHSGNISNLEAWTYLVNNGLLDESYPLPTVREVTVVHTYYDGTYHYDVDLSNVIDENEYVIFLKEFSFYTNITMDSFDNKTKIVTLKGTDQRSSITLKFMIMTTGGRDGI